MFYVYILLCSDKSFYIGHTENLEYRLSEHNNRKYDGYTSTRLPVELVFAEAFQSRAEALEIEHKLKKWSRKKKEALIKENWSLLKQLSQRRKNNR